MIVYNKFSIPMHKVYYIIEYKMGGKWFPLREHDHTNEIIRQNSLESLQTYFDKMLSENKAIARSYPDSEYYKVYADSANWRVKKITEIKTEEIIENSENE